MAVVREIQLGDEVKNINGNDISGTVIAKYVDQQIGSTLMRLDVRGDERVYYGTLMKNWKTIIKVEDIE